MRFSLSFRVVEFLDRQRLTGETALAHEEVFRGQQPYIARNHVACGQFDDVTRHQVAQWDLPCRAVPNNRGGHVDHGLELLRGGVRPRFLPETQSTLSATMPAITVPARASPVRKEIADRVESKITSGLRMIFRTRTGQPCFRSCAISFGPVCARFLRHQLASGR